MCLPCHGSIAITCININDDLISTHTNDDDNQSQLSRHRCVFFFLFPFLFCLLIIIQTDQVCVQPPSKVTSTHHNGPHIDTSPADCHPPTTKERLMSCKESIIGTHQHTRNQGNEKKIGARDVDNVSWACGKFFDLAFNSIYTNQVDLQLQ